MTKKKIIILAVAATLIVGLTGLYFLGNPPQEKNQEQAQEEASGREEEFPQELKKLSQHHLDQLAEKGVLIKVTSQGFDPKDKEVSVKKEESLSFANLDDKLHKIFGDEFLQDGKEIGIATSISIPIKEEVNWQFWLEAYPETKLKVIVE